jgi:glyoxylase-like metal-dependent hydrolase (beta-lactamase superfamily II)
MAARSAKFGLSVVTKLKERLVEAPDREVAEVSKQGVIERLIPELIALHERGHTWSSIAALLGEEGVQISGTALGAYVRRGSATGGAKKDNSKRKPLQRTIDATAHGASPGSAAPRPPTARAAVASEASPAPRRPATEPSSAGVQPPTLGTARSSFTPRRHSDDI